MSETDPAAIEWPTLRDRLGRESAVILPGNVAPEDVPLFLQASDFLVLPSYSEGLPQAVLEAMNCGLAVVATRVGGVPEAVIDGRTGLLVEAKNVEQLRDAMERMIGDEAFRLAAGREGLARAREVFDSERNAGRFADALWSLAKRCAGAEQLEIRRFWGVCRVGSQPTRQQADDGITGGLRTHPTYRCRRTIEMIEQGLDE